MISHQQSAEVDGMRIDRAYLATTVDDLHYGDFVVLTDNGCRKGSSLDADNGHLLFWASAAYRAGDLATLLGDDTVMVLESHPFPGGMIGGIQSPHTESVKLTMSVHHPGGEKLND